jgi:hypothetical protein
MTERTLADGCPAEPPEDVPRDLLTWFCYVLHTTLGHEKAERYLGIEREESSRGG